MNDSAPYDVTQDQQGKPISPDDAAPARPLKQIGRYRIEKVLGKGGFGLVYLAHDEQLDRLVAIKVPHAKLISKPEDAKAYLTEARTVANLDHPGIVPVHDVGSTEECPCYVVSKYIEGTDLSRRLKENRLKYREAAELVTTVAEALHYAHKQGLVHRDVKPGNILIGKDGRPYVVDFGLALREESIGKGPKYAGTPAYMSPEQVRGEGHRVDGRSDIFSLGVVFYELLAGRQPFQGDTQAELFEQVTSYEAKPLRQYDEKLPKELERICHKAMAKRASERYSSAYDLAEDLRLFLSEQTVIQSGTSPGGVFSSSVETVDRQSGSTTAPSIAVSSATVKFDTRDSHPIKIVPKGLRSFDAHDADFFLELLPGPRDREGLPDSLRFWKTRIEETDPDNTFSVGLIYGPSGCGKSSLVKAGLLPRLSEDVISVYIEATPEDTETRLLHGLRKRCPALEDNLSLKDTLAVLRRGQGIPVDKKVLIVLDQFEQWLHAKKEEENTDLVQALRQCDGGRVQCVVMVRDDFWMAATRLMRELEVRLVEARNSAAVDLFPIRHAEKVLSAFGRAFGTLPDNLGEINKEQTEFIKKSINGLAEEGKVICVRLALFAEMMKGKAWTPAILREVGGTRGVGITFLEETFSAKSAPPEHRYHQKAARFVLMALLPDSGSEIKGAMKSYDELLKVSGYARRLKDFDDLICILDGEIRLITPTDPEAIDDEQSVAQTEAGQKYYQLTHDYLVHSLRNWLNRKQQESKQGRAELSLADRAAVWNGRPENRQLPSLVQWLQIKWRTDKKRWTEPQKKMMARSGRYHIVRGLITAVLLAAITFGGLVIRNALHNQQKATYAAALVDSLVSADIAQVPKVIEDLKEYREMAEPLLNYRISKANDGSPEKLKLALALLPSEERHFDYLVQQLLVCTPKQFSVLRESMLRKDEVSKRLWDLLQDDQALPGQRFQAAAVLAEYTPQDERWQESSPFVSQYLTTDVSSADLGNWVTLLEPASGQLVAPLSHILADRRRNAREREAAAYVLSRYASDMPEQLLDAILVSDEHEEFSPLIGALSAHASDVKQRLLAEMRAEMLAELDKTNAELSDEDQQHRDDHWKRQSLAAVALVHLGFGDEVWPLMKFTPNPSLKSFIIHHLGSLGTDHNTLAARLELEQDDPIRRALIQSLGGLNVALIPSADRHRIAEQLKTLYVNHPDSGIHSSASWTLRRWGEKLPELPAGEPTLIEEQEARIAKLTADVEDIRQRIAILEKELQVAWERKLATESDLFSSVPTDGRIVHFPLDESKGRAIVNAAKPSHKGVFAGPNDPDWISGVFGSGIRLDGSKQQFDCGDVFRPEHTDSFSFGCWFLVDDNGEHGTLFSKWHYGEHKGRGFILEVRPSESRFLVMLQHLGWGDAVVVASQDHLTRNQWHHLFVNYDGSSKADGVRCYFNGSLHQTMTWRDSLTGTIHANMPLQIGGRNGPHEPLAGAIDDVRIYNRELSDQEVKDLFLSGLVSLACIAPEKRTPEQQETLNKAYRPEVESFVLLSSQLAVAEKLLNDARWNGLRRWYVNEQGQTMVILRPSDAGNPNSTFAIASHEVTVAEFRRFRNNYSYDAHLAPSPDCAVHYVSWVDAVAYCNWLNEQEGIPVEQWAYVIAGENEIVVKENAHQLNGYRLPSGSEWELACRSGAMGSYCFGEPIAVLDDYAVWGKTAGGYIHPVESLLPNEFGIFDMHGNLVEWCSDENRGSGVKKRLLRGGAFFRHTAEVQVNYRLYYDASLRSFNVGFRPAKTYRNPSMH